jgi:AraC-like DNA-binding protein
MKTTSGERGPGGWFALDRLAIYLTQLPQMKKKSPAKKRKSNLDDATASNPPQHVEPFEPAIRFFWEGGWPRGHIEFNRRIFDCELIYVSRGSYDLILKDRKVRMKRGMMVIIPPNCWHESRAGKSSIVHRHCIHFDWLPNRVNRKAPLQSWQGEAFDEELMEAPPLSIASELPAVFSVSEVKPIIPIFESFLQLMRKEDKAAYLLLWPVLRYLVGKVKSIRSPEALSGKTTRGIFALKLYLQQEYAKPVTMQEMQKISGFSPSYLCIQFRRIIGHSPGEYLNTIRLSHALRLMRETNLRISEVSYQVGFNSPNYFSRICRQKFGVPPTALASKRP